MKNNQPTIEHRRLEAQRKGGENWQLWGSYLLGAVEIIGLVLTNEQAVLTQGYCEAIFKQRHQEADKFYQSLLPANASRKDQRIFRQAMAGMIWNKQYYHFDVARWQDGDKIVPPPKERIGIRNRHWRHLKAHDIVAMPDCWEGCDLNFMTS